MKKFAIIAAVVAGFLGITAAADAGYYAQRCVGYDHCGRPVYRVVYVETCQPRYYGGGFSVQFSRPSYYNNCRPSYRSHCRPSYSYRSRCR